MESTNLLIIFLTGLTTGGLTCLALQGGLLTSVLTNQSNEPIIPASNKKNKINQSSLPVIPAQAGEVLGNPGKSHKIFPNSYLPIFSFLTAKLFIHTLLGFLLGLIGASVTLSPVTRGWLQIAIGVYLFGVAGNLLNLHPFFRYFVITPPKFLAKLTKNKSQSSSVFAPAVLGLMTVFIPCATTQAMEVIALGTGNALYGAAVMFAFVLGTTPTFLLFGFLLEKGSNTYKKYFPTIASVAMIVMSIFSINTGIAVMGSPYTIQNFYSVATGPSSSVIPGSDPESRNSVLNNNIQTATITVSNYGYSPQNITLKKGILTKLKLVTNNVQSCSRAFTIPKLKISKILPETGETIIEFTPQNEGSLAFSCSMGMYTGKFNIIN